MFAKKLTHKSIFITVFFVLLFSFACQQESIICTKEWRALSIKIIDSADSPVILDDYYTTNNNTGEIFRMKDIDTYIDSLNKLSGEYMIMTDNQKHWAKNGYCKVTFKGFLNKKEVVSEEYSVTADACHIGDLIGRTTIVINP